MPEKNADDIILLPQLLDGSIPEKILRERLPEMFRQGYHSVGVLGKETHLSLKLFKLLKPVLKNYKMNGKNKKTGLLRRPRNDDETFECCEEAEDHEIVAQRTKQLFSCVA